MKRDMDLVRSILLAIEEQPDDTWKKPEFEDFTVQQVHYHLQLLEDAGLIDLGAVPTSGGGLMVTSTRLTWEGHEFLEAARDEKLYKKVVKEVLEKTGGLAFEVVKMWLLNEAKGLLPG